MKWSTWELSSHTEHLHHVETFEAPSEYYSQEHSVSSFLGEAPLHTHTPDTSVPHTDVHSLAYTANSILLHVNIPRCAHTDA